jgi:hypothetical protein
MNRYKSLNKDAGVTDYETGEDFISVKFKGGPDVYVYSYEVTGKEHVERMKILALKGRGLSTYITQHAEVKENFSKK